MTLAELKEALAECLDVEEQNVADLLDSPVKEIRRAAALAVARTKIRQAMYATQRLAREHDYQHESSVGAVDQLSKLADVDEPYLEMVKQLGIQAAGLGRFDRAMTYLQLVTTRGAVSGQRADKRSRAMMRYSRDREIDAAILSLTRLYPAPLIAVPPLEPFRIAITCTAVQDEDGPTVLIMKRAEHFKALGYDVRVVASTLGNELVSETKVAQLRAMGVPYLFAPSNDLKPRVEWMIEHFKNDPVHAISWTTSLYDNVGKFCAAVGLAPVQAWENRSLEPYIGKFDLVYQGVDPRQEQFTEFPGASKYYGSSVMMAEEIDAAVPLSRSELGVPDDAVVLGTFGRMEKCNTPVYLDAMSLTLRSNPNAWLVLAGRDGLGAIEALQQRFRTDGVLERVRYLGPRQNDAPALVKSIDIYCDTYPWVGGQTLLDAMQAGRPIVAMRPAPDATLDPTGMSSITAVATNLLSGLVELARAGDAADYARIASTYVRDAAARERDGRAIREKAVRDCNPFQKSKEYAADMRAIFLKKMAACGYDFRTTSVNS